MQDSAADVGPAVTNWRESRPRSSIRLKPDQEGVSGLGNPWPAEAAQAGPEASSGDDLRDDETEPLPLFAAPAAAPPSLRRKHHRRMLRVVRRSPLAANGGITSLMCRPAMQGYRAEPVGQLDCRVERVAPTAPHLGHAGGRPRRGPCPSSTHGRSPSPAPAVAAVVNVASGGAPAGAMTSARTCTTKV